jgi:hypothetical protein
MGEHFENHKRVFGNGKFNIAHGERYKAGSLILDMSSSGKTDAPIASEIRSSL